MNLINWDKTYKTGITEIDNNHKKVINEVNLLWQDCVRNHRNHGNIETFIDTISKLVNKQFTQEKRLLEQQQGDCREYSEKVLQEVQEDLNCLQMDYSAGLNDYDPEIKLKKILLSWIENFEQNTENSASQKTS